MQLTLADIRDALAVHCDLGSAAGTVVHGVRTDSRAVEPGDVFVCIAGERFDGHDFATQVVAQGAVALIAERDPFAANPAARGAAVVFIVAKAVAALGRLARFHRDRCSARVVGVTGTAGKTTVKELLAQVLAVRGPTARNHMNLNNQIGLPVSMLAATGDEAFWVMEAGISEPHDMDELGAILKPDVALVVNVGAGHTAGLGDRGVAHYKARLLAHLAPGGCALVSADYDDLVREARSVGVASLLFFSAKGRQVSYRAAYVGPVDMGRGNYRLWLDGATVDVTAPFRGEFGAENIIAVAAVAHQLGLTGEEIARGMAQAELPRQRFACTRIGKWTVIDDTYNANPLSAARMVDAAAEMADGGSLVYVLGEMLELGTVAEAEHEKLGRHVAATSAAAVLWKGGCGDAVAAGLAAGKYNGTFATVTDAGAFLDRFGALGLDGGVVLFKGSRGNRLEQLVAALTASLAPEETHAL